MEKNLEQRSLVISAIGAFCMALLGLFFGIRTSSEAIMMDGYFSLTGFVVSLITLQAAKLIALPENKSYHFGLSTLEPLVNLCKGLIMLVICVCAASNAILSIRNGGNPFRGEEAVWYAFIATAFCAVLYGFIKKNAKKLDSPILRAESSNWLIDCVISAAVGIAFLMSFLFKDLLGSLNPFLDSIIVLMMVAVMIKIPLDLIKNNLHEVLLGAPEKRLQDEIKSELEVFLKEVNFKDIDYRITRTGRNIYAVAKIYLLEDYAVSKLTKLKHKIENNFKANTFVDLSFNFDG